jgi:hypothetical protein
MKATTGPLRLHNRTCIYCGRDFGNSAPRTKDHVIGRNFVPKGSFKSNDWNLTVWACRRCNNEKAKLEGEISAITLQPGIATTHADRSLTLLAERKASKTRSEATGKTVRESREMLSLTHSLGPDASMTFGFVGLPRLVPDRVLALAEAQIHAFFYFLTYDESQGKGSSLPGGISWSMFAQKGDWGNAQFLAFASLTRDWIGRVSGTAAEHYFRIVIKRDPSEPKLWSFGLEWNRNYRVVGFFGDTKSSSERVGAFPSFEWVRIDETTRRREEIPLKPSEDVLFDCLFED